MNDRNRQQMKAMRMMARDTEKTARFLISSFLTDDVMNAVGEAVKNVTIAMKAVVQNLSEWYNSARVQKLLNDLSTIKEDGTWKN